MKENNSITMIPILSTEWSVSLDVTFLGEVSHWGSVILFRVNDDGNSIGDRIPSIYTYPSSTSLLIQSDADTLGRHLVSDLSTIYKFQVGKKIHIEIHQRYLNGGIYRTFTSIDGVEIASFTYNNVKLFHNVKVHAGSGSVANAKISNFKHTNFM